MTTKTKPRILIVDDEPVFLRTLSELCTGMGCAVTTAADGKQALDILAKEEFVLVISDIRMPNMNGVSLLDCIESRGIDLSFSVYREQSK